MENVSQLKDYNIFHIPKINDYNIQTDLIGLIDASCKFFSKEIFLHKYQIIFLRIHVKHMERCSRVLE